MLIAPESDLSIELKSSIFFERVYIRILNTTRTINVINVQWSFVEKSYMEGLSFSNHVINT